MGERTFTIGALAQAFADNSKRELPCASYGLRRNLTGRFLVTEGFEEKQIPYDHVRDIQGSSWGPSENPHWSAVAAPELTRVGRIAYKYGTRPWQLLNDMGAILLPRTLVEEAESLNYYQRRKEIGEFNAEVRRGKRQVTVYEGKI